MFPQPGCASTTRVRRLSRTAAVQIGCRKHLDGQAVDLWPLEHGRYVVFTPDAQRRVASAMKRAARELGVAIGWGGDWRRRKDPSHFELR